MWVIIVIIGYLFLVFILSHFFIPHLGFRKERLPKKLPKSLQAAINDLKRKNKDSLAYTKASYKLLSKKFKGTHAPAFFRFDILLSRDINRLWNLNFLPCNQISMMMRLFLVKSGRFSEKQVHIRYCVIWVMLHQYLQINYKNEWIDVDVWGYHAGIPFGKHPHFFTMGWLYVLRQKLFKSRKKV